MNFQKIKEKVGKEFRLRPFPRRFDGDKELPPSDDSWLPSEVQEEDGKTLVLQNQATGHVLRLGGDNVKERRSPDFLILRCQVSISPRGIRLEPFWGGGGEPGS